MDFMFREKMKGILGMSNSTEQTRVFERKQISRRSFMSCASGLGLTSTVMSGALWAKVAGDKEPEITKEMLQDAERLAGLEFTEDERELMVEGLNGYLQKYRKLREVPLDNSIAPALQFNPVVPGMSVENRARRPRISRGRGRKVPS
ncbi:MAG: hypothetical protein JSW59_11440, partial [Phycisphaerales bacterium]